MLQPLFKDAARAELIAQTEAIRVFNEGAFERWTQVGVTRAVWQTVRDSFVCPVCRRLHGTVAEIETGWTHPGGTGDEARYEGQTYRDSAHPGCRCFRRPLVE
jgi:hypothetical protein